MKEFSEVLAKELTEKLAWFEIKELSENWSFKVVASDETVDRAWEVIKVAWRELNNYMKNPIILFWHKYSTLTDIVGKATAVYTEGTSLIVEWVFASTEPAQMLRQLYDDGIIKTVSVGFIPKERDPEDRKIITRAELLELSFVPVPCNPNALSLWKEIMEDLVSKWILVKENEEAPVEEEATTEEVEGENVEGEVVEGEEVVEDETPTAEEDTKAPAWWIAERKSLLADIKDLISKDNADDNAGELEDKDAKIKMQKEALQNVSKVVSDCLHKIKL